MSPIARDRLLNPAGAFDHPATLPLLLVAVAPLVLAPLILRFFRRRIPVDLRKDLWRRYPGWLLLVPVMAGTVLLGAGWVIAGVTVLSLLCFREFARATGLFREKLICYLAIAGIGIVHFAALDNWNRLFTAAFPLTIACVAGFAAAQDRPQGYLQRVALAIFAFSLFGSCLGHLSLLANDTDYRPRIALVLIAVAFWDVARFVVGRLVRGPKLVPNTEPNRAVSGTLAGAVVVIAFVMAAGWFVFEGTRLQDPVRLAVFGLLIAVAAQLGDLMLAAIKRDTGVVNLDRFLPGQGGLLDRFDSLILVAPVAFNVINYFAGVGLGQPVCIITGAR